jgi:hypothetical protein
MIKLTVMYTLPEGSDHEAFLKWRTGEHQEENMGIPGVIKTDFYKVAEIYSHQKSERPGNDEKLQAENLVYRYVTESYWPDMESFKSAFFNSEYQKELMGSLQKIANPIFLVSEEVLSETV